MPTPTDAFNQAINFALDPDTDEGLEFLRAWREGDFETIEAEWPEFDTADSRAVAHRVTEPAAEPASNPPLPESPSNEGNPADTVIPVSVAWSMLDYLQEDNSAARCGNCALMIEEHCYSPAEQGGQ